jgi:cell division septation protein DedD
MGTRTVNGTNKGTSRPSRPRAIRLTLVCIGAAALFFLGIYTAEFVSRRYNPPGPADPFELVDAPHATTAPLLPPEAAAPLPTLSFFDTLAGKKPAEELLITPQQAPEGLPDMREPPAPSPPDTAGVPRAVPPQPSAPPPEAVYTIQLGSFENAQAARDFSVRLAEKGYEPYIQMVDIPGKGRVYRVRMGRVHSLEEAQQLAKEFERTEKMSVLITSR